jgi:hypothetical protein
MSELRNGLLDVPAPGEPAAHGRTWTTVRAAFEEREPLARPFRYTKPLLAFAVVAAVIAAALTPPGRALADEVRDAFVGVESAQPELFSLPAPGRALVESGKGLWVLRQDGSRRLIGPYHDAAWSPHGLFIAAVRGNQLAALDDRGKVRWSVARRGFVGSPSWTGTQTDTRIAYLAGSVPKRELRVIAGDGTDDHMIARRVAPVTPAWRPGPERPLAFVLRSGRRSLARTRRSHGPARVERRRPPPPRCRGTPVARLRRGWNPREGPPCAARLLRRRRHFRA